MTKPDPSPLRKAIRAVLKKERDPVARKWLRLLLRGDRPTPKRRTR